MTTLRWGAATDVGRLRRVNEDSVLTATPLFAVADGMGGHAGGEVASDVALTTLEERFAAEPRTTEALVQAVRDANTAIYERALTEAKLHGMGTTLTALLISGRAIAMVHIGDSRAYLLRDGRLRQVTKDHTYVQMLVDEGAITAEEASHHPHRSLVTQVLQGEPIEPNYSVREAIKGDRYLLCSDGLSNVVSMATMGDVLRDYRDADACAERLIDLALRAGGPDNITAIVADIVAVDDSDPQVAVAHRANAPAEERPSPRPRPARAAPGGVERPAPEPTGEQPASWWARHRLTLVLVLTLGVLLAAAGVWYVVTG